MKCAPDVTNYTQYIHRKKKKKQKERAQHGYVCSIERFNMWLMVK